MVDPSPSEELPLPGPEEGTEVTAVDPADGERCCHHYPGIKGQCTADADVIVIYEGENVYNSPSEAPYCEEHVNLPDWIWERLEEQQLVTDGGTEAKEGPGDDEFSLNNLDPTEAEEVGVNEVTDALETVEAGDILELRVSFMSEAAGEHRETFRMRVVSNEPTEYDTPYRIDLEFPSRSALWSPPKHGDWYITGGTAKRESSRIAYSIDSLKLWRRSS